MLKFGSKGDSNVVYKCTVKLLEDTDILECEFRVRCFLKVKCGINYNLNYQAASQGKILARVRM